MRVGWSDKDAQAVLGIGRVSNVSAALNPAVDKIAKLWAADPTRTMNMILAAVAELPMPDEEIEARSAMLEGRGARVKK